MIKWQINRNKHYFNLWQLLYRKLLIKFLLMHTGKFSKFSKNKLKIQCSNLIIQTFDNIFHLFWNIFHNINNNFIYLKLLLSMKMLRCALSIKIISIKDHILNWNKKIKNLYKIFISLYLYFHLMNIFKVCQIRTINMN